MKKVSILLLLICHQHSIAQLSGKLTNAGGQPIAMANVQLLHDTDSSLVKATITDETGAWQIDNIAFGKYMLRITCMGYQKWESPVFGLTEAQPAVYFGTEVLKANQKQLQEVVMRAGKPLFQQRPEGITVNVESSVLSKGSTALDLLVRSPGVAIDYRNNSISLNGKSGVQVMIDGRLLRMSMEQLVQFLNGTSANDIGKIELLTTPPVQYDAEGSAGIINIVLKKNRRPGTSGSITATAGYGWGEKTSGSINLAHNNNKLNLYGSYSYMRDHSYSDMHISSFQNMPVLGGDLHVLVWDTSKAIQNNHDITFGMDATVNPKTTIGGMVNFNTSARNTVDHNRLHYSVLPDSLLLFEGSIFGANRWKNLVSSFYADRTLGTGEKIHVNADYLYFKNTSPTTVQSNFVNEDGAQAGNNDSLFAPSQRGFANTTIRVGVVKLDYTRQLNSKLKLEAGLKGAYTNSTSGSGIESLINGDWVQRSETVENINMKEGIGAAYASVNAQLNAAASLSIGARYEYAYSDMNDPDTKSDLLTRKQGAFFPGITFIRKLNEHSELQLTWTKRISRPSYNDLASNVRYADPSAVMTGNPLLKPTITNNIKLGYNYSNYIFSLLFSRDDHPIARYMLTESPQRNLLFVSPQNLAWQNNITLQANLPFTITNWWNMSYSFTGGWRQFKIVHTKQPVEKTYWAWSLNASQSFNLPARFTLELSGWYNSTLYSGTVKVDGMGALNAGVKKELKKNGGTFQLSATNILRTMQVHSYFGAVAEEAFNITNHVAFNVESRVFPIIKLSYTRLLGNSSNASKPVNGSNEERDRIRKE